MNMRVEKSGPITTVILNRPDVRNAIDSETAASLAKAFRAFDADEAAKVAVLYGDHGVFCAGADLKARAAGYPLRVEPVGQTVRWGFPACVSPNRSLPLWRGMRWPADWNSRCGVIFVWPKKMRYLAC